MTGFAGSGEMRKKADYKSIYQQQEEARKKKKQLEESRAAEQRRNTQSRSGAQGQAIVTADKAAAFADKKKQEKIAKENKQSEMQRSARKTYDVTVNYQKRIKQANDFINGMSDEEYTSALELGQASNPHYGKNLFSKSNEEALNILYGTGDIAYANRVANSILEKQKFDKETKNRAISEKVNLQNYLLQYPEEIAPTESIESLKAKADDAYSRYEELRNFYSAQGTDGMALAENDDEFLALREEVRDADFAYNHAKNYKGYQDYKAQMKAYTDLTASEDFAQKAAEGASYSNPELGKTGEVGNPLHKKLDEYSVTSAIAATQGTADPSSKLTYLTDDEIGIYDYLLATKGKDEAENYLKFMDDELNKREGHALAQETLNIDNRALQSIATTLRGIGSGTEQFMSGMKQVGSRITGSDAPVKPSMVQYAGQEIRQNIEGAQAIAFDLGQTTANMFPSMVVSVINPYVGTALMGVSAGGNAYTEARNLGRPDNEAVAYGMLIGTSEALLRRFMGGVVSFAAGGPNVTMAAAQKISTVISKLAKNPTAQKAIQKILGRAVGSGGEFIEEYLQEVLDPVFRNVVFDQNNEVRLFSSEALYAGLLGALNAGVLNAPAYVAEDMASLQGGKVYSDPAALRMLIDYNLQSDKGSDAYRIAEQLDKQLAAGGSVSLGQIGALVDSSDETVRFYGALMNNPEDLDMLTGRVIANNSPDSMVYKIAEQIQLMRETGQQVPDELVGMLVDENQKAINAGRAQRLADLKDGKITIDELEPDDLDGLVDPDNIEAINRVFGTEISAGSDPAGIYNALDAQNAMVRGESIYGQNDAGTDINIGFVQGKAMPSAVEQGEGVSSGTGTAQIRKTNRTRRAGYGVYKEGTAEIQRVEVRDIDGNLIETLDIPSFTADPNDTSPVNQEMLEVTRSNAEKGIETYFFTGNLITKALGAGARAFIYGNKVFLQIDNRTHFSILNEHEVQGHRDASTKQILKELSEIMTEIDEDTLGEDYVAYKPLIENAERSRQILYMLEEFVSDVKAGEYKGGLSKEFMEKALGIIANAEKATAAKGSPDIAASVDTQKEVPRFSADNEAGEPISYYMNGRVAKVSPAEDPDVNPEFAESSEIRFSVTPYNPTTKAYAEYEKGLNEKARILNDAIMGVTTNDTVKIGGEKQKIGRRFYYTSEWNENIKKSKAFAAKAKDIAGLLPAETRNAMHMDASGVIELSEFDKLFKMRRSIVQRIIDAQAPEMTSSVYKIGSLDVRLGKGDNVLSTGGESLRRAITAETRKMFFNGTLRQASLGSLHKDPRGALGFLAGNTKTGGSGDFTTLCPQMFFNKGCMYCYRRAALESGVNNKLVGENVWYTGDILRLSDKIIGEMNKAGGLRIQSFGDWMPQMTSQLADVLYDAEIRGLQVKIITKEKSMVNAFEGLRDQGLGVSSYFNLSADYAKEEAGSLEEYPNVEDNGQDRRIIAMNPERADTFERRGEKAYWKRALSPSEAYEFTKDKPFVNIRIVALTIEEAIRGLKDPHVKVVTGYHGHMRQFERIDSESGAYVVEVEPIGDSGLPRFIQQKDGSWVIDPKNPGRTKVHKKLATAILENNLVMEYYAKMCCITGRCATCVAHCGKGTIADTLDVKNMTNDDTASVQYWKEHAYWNGLQNKGTDNSVRFSLDTDSEGNQLSEAQAEFFKDSKVRDEQGRLLVVYHGTYWHDFYKFERGDIGFHFGSKEQANKRLKDPSTYYGKNKPRLISAYLNLKNPIYVYDDAVYWDAEDIIGGLEQMGYITRDEADEVKNAKHVKGQDFYYEAQNVKLRDILSKKGYDGIVYPNLYESSDGDESYIAFYPEQIKETTNLNPTENPDIRFSVDDEAQVYAERRNAIEEIRAAAKTGTVEDVEINNLIKADQLVAKYERELALYDQQQKFKSKEERDAYIVSWKKNIAKADADALRSAAVLSAKKAGNEKLQKAINHYRNVIDSAAERRRRSADNQELLKQVRALDQLSKKVLPDMKKRIQELIGEIDKTAVNITDRGRLTLEGIDKAYSDMKANDPNFIKNIAVEEKLKRLKEGTIHIGEMSVDDVRDLTDVLKNIRHEIRTSRAQIRKDKAIQTYELAMQAIEEMKKATSLRASKLGSLYIYESARPETFFAALGGYKKGSVWDGVYEELAAGQRKAFMFQMQASKKFQSFIDKHKKLIDKWEGKDAEFIDTGVFDEYAESLKITPAQRISLYLHSKNDQNMAHVSRGGVISFDISQYKKKDIEEALAGQPAYTLTKTDIEDIVSKMTAEEREFADLAYDFFNTDSKNAINETSRALLGYDIATVEHYFPLKTTQDAIESGDDNVLFNGTLEGAGPLQKRQDSGLPIILEDVTSLLLRHIDFVSKYYGLAIPLRNEKNLRNVKVIGKDGKESVQHYISVLTGAKGMKYIRNLREDLQGVRRVQNSALDKLRGKFAQAILGFNVGSPLKQVASLPLAAATLGWDAISKSAFGKADHALIDKYTALMWLRRQGLSTVELGDVASRRGWASKMPALMGWIQAMDVAVTGRVWVAAEWYVKKHFPELKAGTDEYYMKVAEWFEKAVEQTQSNYAIMQKPQILRTDNKFVQQLTMFMTDRLQMFNTLREAHGRLEWAKREYKTNKSTETKEQLREAQETWRRSVTGSIGSLAWVTAVTMVVNMLLGRRKKYEDEEGNMTAESVIAAGTKEFFGNAAAMVLMGNEIYGAIDSWSQGKQPYDIEAPSLGSINDFIKSVGDAGMALSEFVSGIRDVSAEDGSVIEYMDANKSDVLKAGLELAKTASVLLGIPVGNIEKYVIGFIKRLSPEFKAAYEDAFNPADIKALKAASDKEFKATYFRVIQNRMPEVNKFKDVYNEIGSLAMAYRATEPEMVGKLFVPDPPKSFSQDSVEYILTESEKLNYGKTMRSGLAMALSDLINSDAYEAMDDAHMMKAIGYLIGLQQEDAKAALLKKRGIDMDRNDGYYLKKAGIGYDVYAAFKTQDDIFENSEEDPLKEQYREYVDSLTDLNAEQREILFMTRYAADNDVTMARVVSYIQHLDLSDSEKAAIADSINLKTENGKIYAERKKQAS